MVKETRIGKRKRFPQEEESVSTQSAVSTQSTSLTTQSAQGDYYDSQAEDIEGELATQEPTQQSDEPAHKKRLVTLTDKPKEPMADWIKDNTALYNKGKKEYWDVDKKEALWAAQAQVMGISGEFC